ncbi:MAG TPA: DUF4097 family beta strand repeat-containing protein [Candidatus Dormibacteraeota bacterium]|nr:DUF4097 family beta strand repeat-containing protein [Candidatus Dormibacteraeota bacterium]
MQTFSTPEPIAVTVEIGAGTVRIVAGDRTDTTVEVRPGDPGRKRDVAAADGTRVEFDAGRLAVRGPRGWRPQAFLGGYESVAVDVAVPRGSSVRCDVGGGTVRMTGVIGECAVKTGAGEVSIGEAGPLAVHTGAGDVTVERAGGHVDIATGAGSVRIAAVAGTATVKSSYGDTWIGEVSGEVRVQGAHGRVTVERADATVAARTSSGDIRLGEVSGGSVEAQTAFGSVDVGIRDGVPAWLDLDTRYGAVTNRLEASGQPGAGERVVEVRARTSYGRITVRRAQAGVAAGSDR